MPDNCREACPYLHRIETLEQDSERNKRAHKDFYDRREKSHTSVALIEERIGQVKADTEEIKLAVQELRAKPGKRWDGIVDKLIWAVLGGVVAFLMARIGL